MSNFNTKNKEKNKIKIFQTADNKTEIKVMFEQETVWLTQKQFVLLFNSSKANISEHIKHILKQVNWMKLQLFGISEQLKKKAEELYKKSSFSSLE